jgi:hypothetical protein
VDRGVIYVRSALEVAGRHPDRAVEQRAAQRDRQADDQAAHPAAPGDGQLARHERADQRAGGQAAQVGRLIR